MSPPAPVSRSPANLAALRLNITVMVISSLTNAAIFPFFALVAAKKTDSELVVGAIFAANPLAMCFVSIATPWLSQRFGRIRVLSFGLVLAMVALVGFGFVESIWAWFLFRALHGASSALIDGPAGALLLAHSSDIAEDLGLSEAASGLSYMVGPAAGGAIFAAVGLRGTFVVLAALYLIGVGLLPFTLRGLPSPATHQPARLAIDESGGCGYNELESEGSPSRKSASTSVPPLSNVSPWVVLGRERAVWIGGVVNVFMFASTTFYDIALPLHLKATLGLGARGIGFVYFSPAMVYMCFSTWHGTLCRFAGARNVLLAGLLVCGFVFLICGPVPPLAALGRRHFSGDSERTFAWVCVCTAMATWGFGLCPGFQATLPLMDAALKNARNKSSQLSDDDDDDDGNYSDDEMAIGERLRQAKLVRLNEHSTSLVMKEREDEGSDPEASVGSTGKNEFHAATVDLAIGNTDQQDVLDGKRAEVEDALSALIQATSALGQVLGPILGGLGLQSLPQTRDPGCRASDSSNESGSDGCLSGFSWTTMLLSFFFFAAAAATTTLPDLRQEEKTLTTCEASDGLKASVRACVDEKGVAVFAVADGVSQIEDYEPSWDAGIDANQPDITEQQGGVTMSFWSAADRQKRYMKKSAAHSSEYNQLPQMSSPMHLDCTPEGIEFQDFQ